VLFFDGARRQHVGAAQRGGHLISSIVSSPPRWKPIADELAHAAPRQRHGRSSG
jgi:hypothetical protein